MSSIHQAAGTGFARASATYASGRPEYPEAIVGWLRDTLGLGSGRRAIDIGAGTGKFTARLVATGADVIAVEPVAEMRRALSARFPDMDARSGTAEAIPLDDCSVDVVACAQAFHWFATPAALDEMRRVLRPGGHLCLIWNVRDESVPWVAALTDIMTPYEGDAPRYHSGAWRRVFPADGFSDLTETVFPHSVTGSPEAVIIDRVMSVSFIAALPLDEQERVRARVRGVISTTNELQGRAEITFPYATWAFVTTKIGS